MKLLIIGATGVFGSRLYNDAVRKKWNLLGTYCTNEYEGLFHLDLRDRKSIEKVFNLFTPEVVVLAGGITNVDICESKPKLALEVNIKGTLRVIRKVKEFDAKLVFISTDYIFDGKSGPYKEGHSPSPLSVYGRTKLEGEEAIKTSLDNYLIIRTSQLYGMDHRKNNYAIKIIHNMRNNRKVCTASDFYSTPTYVGSLSSSIIKLLETGKTGIYNVAGCDFLNRYDYVNIIADIFSLNKALIQKATLKDLHLEAKRPKRGGLIVDKIESEIGVKMLGCREGLRLFKEEMSL